MGAFSRMVTVFGAHLTEMGNADLTEWLLYNMRTYPNGYCTKGALSGMVTVFGAHLTEMVTVQSADLTEWLLVCIWRIDGNTGVFWVINEKA